MHESRPQGDGPVALEPPGGRVARLAAGEYALHEVMPDLSLRTVRAYGRRPAEPAVAVALDTAGGTVDAAAYARLTELVQADDRLPDVTLHRARGGGVSFTVLLPGSCVEDARRRCVASVVDLLRAAGARVVLERVVAESVRPLDATG